MKYIGLLLLFITTPIYSQVLFVANGDIAGVPIKMKLEVKNNEDVSGEYSYKKTKLPIHLAGKLDGKVLKLTTDAKSGLNEVFKGQFDISDVNKKLSGKWYGKHGTRGISKEGFPFSVTGLIRLSDEKNISCVDMELVPELSFKAVDLGSGHGSPVEVDYGCPKSISRLDFIQSLLNQANNIRGDNANIPQMCKGSIIHAQWRYFHFDLARLGYFPMGYKNKPYRDLDTVLNYLEVWSYQSLYTKQIYDEYVKEQNRVKPILTKWYQDNHNIEQKDAELYTNFVLAKIANRGFGSYSSSEQFNEYFPSINDPAQIYKLNELNRNLQNNSDTNTINNVINSIESKMIPGRSESPLSNALFNPEYVSLLIDSGFDLNHQNYFGKTPLFYAIQFSLYDSVKILLDKGADINHIYRAKKNAYTKCYGIQKWERTPLMHAAQHADVKMIKLLIKYGANIQNKDVHGSTAYDYALQEGKGENVDFLNTLINKQ